MASIRSEQARTVRARARKHVSARNESARTPSAPLKAGSDQQRLWLCVAGVLAVLVLAYWPALRGPFIFDDYHLPFTDPNAAKAGLSLWVGVRPVLMLTYW